MASKHDEPVDLGQPALVLIHGDSVRKQRPLTRDVTSVGRAHGCDICLEAPDVSALHCLITRHGAGLLIRDCGSRSGTHLNGDAIRELVPLRDSDVLQIGPFSFRVHLPSAAGGQTSSEGMGQELECQRAELERQSTAFQERVREYEQRFERLKQAELALNREHGQLDQLSRGIQAMQLEQEENARIREDWAREQAETMTRLTQQREALAQAEASLREQRAGLSRMMAELKQMQEAIRMQQNADVEALQRENEQLHQLLAERDRERVEASSSDPTHELRTEIELLRQLLAEKDGLLEELRQQPARPAPIGDVPAFEAELNEFQRQLENDRKKLNEEIEQLRARNQELDEATRDMELQLSRERAELARERQRLDRLREDTRLELEKMQRESTVRDRLAPVKKLREEITGTSAAPA